MNSTNLLPVTELSLSNFQWHNEGAEKVLTAEISELPGRRIPMERLYADAADIGFAIKSKTGAVVRFALVKTFPNGEDLGGWEFLGVEKPLRLTIFND